MRSECWSVYARTIALVFGRNFFNPVYEYQKQLAKAVGVHKRSARSSCPGELPVQARTPQSRQFQSIFLIQCFLKFVIDGPL